MSEAGGTVSATLWRGVLVGAAAGIAYGLVEAAYALVTAPLAFDVLGEKLRFALAVPGLSAGAGGLAGAAAALVTLAAGGIAGALSPERRDLWQARICTLVCAPPTAWAVARLFAGRRARLVPGYPVVTALVLVALLFGVHAALLGARRVRRQLVRGELRGTHAAALALSLAGGAVAAILVDHRVLPRLYPAFHLALEACATGALAMAVATVYLAPRVGPRLAARVAPMTSDRGRPITLLVLAAATALSLRSLTRSSTLRAAAYEHTACPSHLLRLAHAAGIGEPPSRPFDPPPDAPLAGPPAAPLPDGPHAPGADVFLITVDAMRADRLTPRTAPRLSALAASGVVFDAAYTQVPHTSFAIASLLTGKYVYSLSALGNDPASHETLADVLKRDRYKTAAFFPPAVFFIDKEKFGEVEKNAYSFEYVKYEYMAASGRTDQVIRFLESERPARVFVWVHYFEPHEPYDLHDGVPEGPGARPPVTAEERYDGEVSYVDREVGRLVDHVRRTRPGAIVAFTADHGEEFGEHGGRYHGTTLYEEQVHVPLFVAMPGLAPRHVRPPVALVDVAPTLLGLADIVPSARMRGRDLGPWMASPPAPDERLGPVFAEIGSKKLVASGSDRLICDVALDFCELYDLRADPGEEHNLAGRDPARLAAARAKLDGWMTSQSRFERDPAPPADEVARRALERGRLGDRGAAADVAALLLSSDAKLRDDAATVLLHLPPEESTRAAVTSARKAAGGPDVRLDVAAFRLGDRALADRVAEAAGSATLSLDVRGPAVLALAEAKDARAVPLAAAVLPRITDEDLEKRLIAALGALGDRRATPLLLEHLDHVRTRVDVVRALGRLGDERAAAALARAAEQEPYVPARAEMARVLGGLGDRAAAPSLARLWRRETEAQVRAEIVMALVRLGSVHLVGGTSPRGTKGWSCDAAGGCLPSENAAVPGGRRARAAPLWWVGADPSVGSFSVGDERVALDAERRAVATAASGAASVTRIEGAPRIAAVVPAQTR